MSEVTTTTSVPGATPVAQQGVSIPNGGVTSAVPAHQQLTQPVAIPPQKVVSQDQFDKFQNQVTGALEIIMEKLEEKPATSTPVSKVAIEAGPDEQTPVPASWINAVHEILGPDFVCEFSQPDMGGSLFKIIVPKDKSNAKSAHWEMHKRDVRTKEIGNTGLQGVKDWCLKVRANLVASGIKLVQYS